MAVLLELGPELDEHGGAEDDGAEDDGVRDHGAVDHRHLGQEEPRLDELDDHGQVILRRREGASRQRAVRTRLGGQRAPLRTAPAMIQRAGDGATADHLRVGPGSKAVGQRATRRPKALAGGQRHRPVPVEVARAHLWTQERVPASPIAHQTIGIIMKACTETVGKAQRGSSAGAQGRRAE